MQLLYQSGYIFQCRLQNFFLNIFVSKLSFFPTFQKKKNRMVTINTFRQLALSFPEASEEPHFEKQSFRVRKKIFATLSPDESTAVVKLSITEQSVFCSFDQLIVFPVKGSWGAQGWTTIELKKIRKDMLKDILTTAYCNVAPKTLAEKIRIKD